MGFPDSSVCKESACNARDPSSILGLEISPGEGKGYLLQYSGLENSVHGVSKSQTWLSNFHFHLLQPKAPIFRMREFSPHLQNLSSWPDILAFQTPGHALLPVQSCWWWPVDLWIKWTLCSRAFRTHHPTHPLRSSCSLLNLSCILLVTQIPGEFSQVVWGGNERLRGHQMGLPRWLSW